jgi:carboxyl-terminal processing protease
MKAPALLAALLIATAAAADPLTPRQRAEDFDTAWRAIDQGYAYFDRNRPAWRRAREAWRPRALRAKTAEAFVQALEGALEQLRDDHVAVSERSAAAPRRVPADSEIWARWSGGDAVVEAVRTFGDADVAGLKPGARIKRIGELPVDQAVRGRWGVTPASTDAERDWALRHALAGPRNGSLRLELAGNGDGGTQAVEIERAAARRGNGPPLIARRVGDERDLGYIRIKHGWGEARLAEQFEGALNYLKDTRALILDLRDLSGAGSREATLGILAQFAATRMPWQVRQAPGGARVTDTVSPPVGADPYRAPVAILVDRWTAGEAEALAAGLAAVANAQLVGTPMAGMRGELRHAKLPHSGLVVSYPGERTFHVDGTPRERLLPDVEVDLAAPSGGPGDPILYQALKLFGKR